MRSASLPVLIHALFFDSPSFLLVCDRSPRRAAFLDVHSCVAAAATLRRSPLPPPRMHTYTPQHKHTILTHYRAGDRSASFHALAQRFAVRAGASAIRKWYQQWDGTPQSLEAKQRSGRPRVLSRKEVQQHVRAPILRANKAHKAVHYSALLPSVRAKTGKEVSARTLRRYGKEELGAKQRRGKKRTADESE